MRLFWAIAMAALVLAGCAIKYNEGVALEQQGRWEEALLAYRDAVIDSPNDPEYREALARAKKVVARDNFEDRIVIYRDTLERDFGHDRELLARQVERTLRHELAHHLGWGERGVGGLGL